MFTKLISITKMTQKVTELEIRIKKTNKHDKTKPLFRIPCRKESIFINRVNLPSHKVCSTIIYKELLEL